MRRTPARYALWSMLVIAPTMIILPALLTTYADLRSPLGADTGPMTAVISIFALMITAFFAPVIIRPEARGIPTMWVVAGLAGFAQLFAVLFGYGAVTPGAAVTGAYIPAAIVCLNLTALILIHAWVASDGMGLSPAFGIATGLAYSFWIISAGTSQSPNAFLVSSSAILLLAFAASIIAALTGSASAEPAAAKDPSGRA